MTVVSQFSILREGSSSAAWQRESCTIESRVMPSDRSVSVLCPSALDRQSSPPTTPNSHPLPNESPNATAISPGLLSHMMPRSVPSTCQRLSVRFSDPGPVTCETTSTCPTAGAAGGIVVGPGSAGVTAGAGGGVPGVPPGPGIGMGMVSGCGSISMRGNGRWSAEPDAGESVSSVRSGHGSAHGSVSTSACTRVLFGAGSGTGTSSIDGYGTGITTRSGTGGNCGGLPGPMGAGG